MIDPNFLKHFFLLLEERNMEISIRQHLVLAVPRNVDNETKLDFLLNTSQECVPFLYEKGSPYTSGYFFFNWINNRTGLVPTHVNHRFTADFLREVYAGMMETLPEFQHPEVGPIPVVGAIH